MPDKKELLLQLLGEDERERLAPLLMQDVLNHGIDLIPDVIQTGNKKGQTLRAHIQNVVCFSYQLAELLNINDREKTHLIAAAYLHDLNKFPEHSGKSYDSIANETNVQIILDKLLKESDYDFDLSTDLVVSVIRGHSSKLHVDGDGFFASDKKELCNMIQLKEHRIKSEYNRKNYGSIASFVGKTRWQIDKRASQQERDAIRILFNFAFYSGIGVKTTQGMGMCRVL